MIMIMINIINIINMIIMIIIITIIIIIIVVIVIIMIIINITLTIPLYVYIYIYTSIALCGAPTLWPHYIQPYVCMYVCRSIMIYYTYMYNTCRYIRHIYLRWSLCGPHCIQPCSPYYGTKNL